VFKQVEVLVLSLQITAVALIFSTCALATVMSAIISILFTRRDNEQYQVRALLKEPTPHGDHDLVQNG